MRHTRAFALGAAFAALAGATAVSAQTVKYELVPGWPQMPAGTFFGTKVDQTGLPCTGGNSRLFCLTPAQKAALKT